MVLNVYMALGQTNRFDASSKSGKFSHRCEGVSVVVGVGPQDLDVMSTYGGSLSEVTPNGWGRALQIAGRSGVIPSFPKSLIQVKAGRALNAALDIMPPSQGMGRIVSSRMGNIYSPAKCF